MQRPDARPDAVRSQREAYGATLCDIADEQPRLLVLDGDLANSTKADIFAERHPSRFIQMGIAEQNLVAVAAGLATEGFIPVVNTFASFIAYRALDQVRVVVAQPRLNVKLAGSYSGLLTGRTGKTHQCFDDLAIMRNLPGMVVLAPADDVETAGALRAAVEHVGPVYIRLTRDPAARLKGSAGRFQIGPAIPLRAGRDATLFSTGQQTVRSLEAARLLAERDISIAVVHLPTLKPFDVSTVVDALSLTPLAVTAEEHAVTGGLGGLIAETLTDRRPMPLLRLGIDDTWGESAPNEALLERHGLDAAQMAKAIEAFVRLHRQPISPSRQEGA
jgi:transketolase